MHNKKFNIFLGESISEIIEEKKRQLVEHMQKERNDVILNCNEDEYIEQLIGDFKIEGIQLHLDKISASSTIESIPVSDLPMVGNRILFDPAVKSVNMEIIRFYIPIDGDKYLLKMRPSRWYSWSPLIIFENGNICFDILKEGLLPEQIKAKCDEYVENIRSMHDYLCADINGYNQSLTDTVRKLYNEKKAHLLHSEDFISDMGIQIKRNAEDSATYSVPPPRIRKKIIVPDNTSPNFSGNLEPTLDSKQYKEILNLIYEMGKQFERQPSTYKNKSEEELRDHFLLFLQPSFNGSDSGEALNKSGKTDILMRYENENIFVAECKFWTGEKGIHDAINQLLSYLTWRDSKVAVLNFVKNKDITSVLKKIKTTISNHPNYLGNFAEPKESWFEYQFHFPGDKNRVVHLAILSFHFPE